MRYQFIHDAEKVYPVTILCSVMKASASGYYAWKKKILCSDNKKQIKLIEAVKNIHKDNEETYGSRRMSKALKKIGHDIGRTAAGTLMKMAGVKAKSKQRFRVTTDSNHNLPVSPNLLERNFRVAQPDKVWVSDITYIWTAAGWLYLAVVIDLYSRKIVGWSTSNRINKELVIKALNMAYWTRKPEKGLIFHSDRGSQYCSNIFKNLLNSYYMRSSMSRKGDCWDNAVSESFFATLKAEKIRGLVLKSREQAISIIFRYIEVFYNRKRFHSYLGYVSPAFFEERWIKQRVA